MLYDAIYLSIWNIATILPYGMGDLMWASGIGTSLDDSIPPLEDFVVKWRPNAKRVIEFKLLTHADEKRVSEELKGYEKMEELTGVSNVLTTRLRHQIVSVDGEKDPKVIHNFVENEFLALDTVEYREFYDKIMPDIELKFDYTSQAGNLHTLDVPLGIEFFWPAARK